MVIRVQQENFDAGREIAAVGERNHAIGGIVCFIGRVRDLGGSETLDSMMLEHYPGMTERELEKIDAEACARWPLEASLIVHRHGRLDPGDQIVLVITASAHRQAAFEANQFLVDWLKTKAPFWKLETTNNGDVWVEAKSSDDHAASRWVAE